MMKERLINFPSCSLSDSRIIVDPRLADNNGGASVGEEPSGILVLLFYVSADTMKERIGRTTGSLRSVKSRYSASLSKA